MMLNLLLVLAVTLPMHVDTTDVDTVGWTKYGDVVTDPMDSSWIVSPFRFGDYKRRVLTPQPILRYTTDTTYYLTPEQLTWLEDMPPAFDKWSYVDSVYVFDERWNDRDIDSTQPCNHLSLGDCNCAQAKAHRAWLNNHPLPYPTLIDSVMPVPTIPLDSVRRWLQDKWPRHRKYVKPIHILYIYFTYQPPVLAVRGCKKGTIEKLWTNPDLLRPCQCGFLS